MLKLDDIKIKTTGGDVLDAVALNERLQVIVIKSGKFAVLDNNEYIVLDKEEKVKRTRKKATDKVE